MNIKNFFLAVLVVGSLGLVSESQSKTWTESLREKIGGKKTRFATGFVAGMAATPTGAFFGEVGEIVTGVSSKVMICSAQVPAFGSGMEACSTSTPDNVVYLAVGWIAGFTCGNILSMIASKASEKINSRSSKHVGTD